MPKTTSLLWLLLGAAGKCAGLEGNRKLPAASLLLLEKLGGAELEQCCEVRGRAASEGLSVLQGKGFSCSGTCPQGMPLCVQLKRKYISAGVPASGTGANVGFVGDWYFKLCPGK